MRIENESIAGYWVDGQLYCYDCVEAQKIDIEDQECILTNDEIEKDDALFFYDNCNQKI